MIIKTFQVLAVVVLAYLGLSSFEYARSYSLDNRQPSLSAFNLFDTKYDQTIRSLKARAREQDKTLEYMVWPQERRQVLGESIGLAKQQLMVTPFKPAAWERLLYLQYEQAPSSPELSWALQNLYTLNGWSHRAIVRMVRYCVPFAFIENSTAPDVCTEITNNLPWQSKPVFLARKIGISADDLNVVIEAFND